MRYWIIGISIYVMVGIVLFGWANNHPSFCYILDVISYNKTTKKLEDKVIKHDLCPAYFALWWPFTIPVVISDKTWKVLYDL